MQEVVAAGMPGALLAIAGRCLRKVEEGTANAGTGSGPKVPPPPAPRRASATGLPKAIAVDSSAAMVILDLCLSILVKLTRFVENVDTRAVLLFCAAPSFHSTMLPVRVAAWLRRRKPW